MAKARFASVWAKQRLSHLILGGVNCYLKLVVISLRSKKKDHYKWESVFSISSIDIPIALNKVENVFTFTI